MRTRSHRSRHISASDPDHPRLWLLALPQLLGILLADPNLPGASRGGEIRYLGGLGVVGIEEALMPYLLLRLRRNIPPECDCCCCVQLPTGLIQPIRHLLESPQVEGLLELLEGGPVGGSRLFQVLVVLLGLRERNPVADLQD